MSSFDAARACIALGSNLGDRPAHLQAAVVQLDAHPSIAVTATSPVYESEAHTVAPDETAPAFLNAVVEGATTLTPDALLDVCHQVERAAGRKRPETTATWAPRPLDLDILTVGRQTVDTPRLTIPHPRLGARRFVLQPWCDLRPNLYVPPPFDATVRQLLDACTDSAALRRTLHALRSPSS